MRYDVTLNALTQAQADGWAADMARAGHIVRPFIAAPVAPVAPVAAHAAPAVTVPVNGLGYEPPPAAPLVWRRSDNGNGYRADDPVLKDGRGRGPLVWLYNDDARPLANGRPGSYVAKANVMGNWLTFADRPELVARFAPAGQPATTFAATRKRRA